MISVSAPKSDRPLIGRVEFEKMKDGVILVNTARCGIVDEASLIDALQSGKVGAAGLDVFEEEPDRDDNPIKAFEQVDLSPHIAGVTQGASERMAIGSAHNMIDFFASRIDPVLVVNRKELGIGVGAWRVPTSTGQL